ncbi:endospore germination permease [Clostridium aestuarii]|uniref:Endospore germination permease n=1 Tax=Clostridium aestuarii TaxID=338193 RepID=A0ABT4CYN7_9CLOT|nr:endospore germination permease [Clostridium aestuarii]MCY6484081.1 endospore germination permease [Clostridium aestuarii]
MNESLTSRQIFFLIFGVIVGYGVVNIAKTVAEAAGSGGWISLTISTLIASIITYIIVYIGYVHKNKTLYDYSQILVGKTVTSIFIFIYIIYFFLIFAMITRISSEIIRLTILIKTPVYVICLLFFLVTYYAVIKGLRNIARICELYGIIIIFSALIIHFLVFTQGTLINLRPFFRNGDIEMYFKSLGKTLFPFLGMEVLTFVPIHEKNTKKVFRYAISAIIFVGIIYIIVVESCISVMGVDDIIHYKDSLIATLRRISIPYLQFLRRVDGIVLTIWIMSVFCTIIIYAYGTVFYISKHSNIQFNILTFIIITAAFIVSQFPKTFEEIEKALEYISYLGLFCAIIIPITLLIITKVKKYDKKIS